MRRRRTVAASSCEKARGVMVATSSYKEAPLVREATEAGAAARAPIWEGTRQGRTTSLPSQVILDLFGENITKFSSYCTASYLKCLSSIEHIKDEGVARQARAIHVSL